MTCYIKSDEIKSGEVGPYFLEWDRAISSQPSGVRSEEQLIAQTFLTSQTVTKVVGRIRRKEHKLLLP